MGVGRSRQLWAGVRVRKALARRKKKIGGVVMWEEEDGSRIICAQSHSLNMYENIEGDRQRVPGSCIPTMEGSLSIA